MPLTKTGEKLLKGFKKRYGKKGESIFYAYIKKHPTKTKKWHN